MTYILLLITLTGGNFEVSSETPYKTMDECFDSRELLVKAVGRPIVNYQALCIIKE